MFKGERGERGSQGSQGNAGATVSSEVFVYETICAYKRRRVAHRSINSEQGKLCMKKNHVYFCRALQEDLAKLVQQATQIRVVMCHQYGIFGLISQMPYGGETSGSIAKCLLFSQATYCPK